MVKKNLIMNSQKIKLFSEQELNSETIAFRVMPLVLQLDVVIMSKFSKSGVYIIDTFWLKGHIKVFSNNDNDNDLAITIAWIEIKKKINKMIKIINCADTLCTVLWLHHLLMQETKISMRSKFVNKNHK